MSKLTHIIIAIFAGYGIYGAVMINGSDAIGAAVAEGIIAAAVIVGKIRRRRRATKNLPAAEKTDEKPGDKSGNS